MRGRTYSHAGYAASADISIPAPARGRTRGIPARRRARLFQFPPPRGGEPDARSCLCGCRDFNSRPREGANPQLFGPLPHPVISIPAPARGRTRGIPARRRARLFQFPPPRGGEPDARSCLCGCRDFNSRPREGANVFPVIFQTRTKYFNSRPREGANMVERYNFPL